jgi:FAD/FMN-containing dehydrogenase
MVENLRNTTKKLVLGYGHIGDGNIHINIIVQEG